LSACPRRLLDVLIREHARHRGRRLWVSVTFDQFTRQGLSRKSIAPGIRRLEAAGLIVVRRGRGGVGAHVASQYRLRFIDGLGDSDGTHFSAPLPSGDVRVPGGPDGTGGNLAFSMDAGRFSVPQDAPLNNTQEASGLSEVSQAWPPRPQQRSAQDRRPKGVHGRTIPNQFRKGGRRTDSGRPPSDRPRDRSHELRPQLLKGTGAGQRCPVPLEPDVQMRRIALVERGWDEQRLMAEFGRFAHYNKAKGNRWFDWEYPWRRWSERSRGIQAQPPSLSTQPERPTPLDLAVATRGPRCGSKAGFTILT
jgi:hypothetical protein